MYVLQKISSIVYINNFEFLFFYFQSYKQHTFEPDPERVKEIITKSIEDAKWIVNKVGSLNYIHKIMYL